MTIAALLPIIIQYGLPVALQLIQMIEKGGNASSADITNLIALAQQNAQSKMMVALLAQGIDPNSAQGKALLALAA